EFVAGFEREHVWSLLHQLQAANDTESRALFAEAILRLGWPGEGQPAELADGLRMIVAERHLDRGDARAAADAVRDVHGIGSVLRLVTDRKFDPLVGDADRVARVRAAIETQDRLTAGALAAAPEDVDALVERATYLRSVGRDRDVLDLLLPLMADPALVVARGQRGFWLVNEAAFALIATGAEDEGIELIRPLASMSLEERPELINTSINFTSLLLKTGRNEEALREVARLAEAGADVVSDYGKMILWGNAACAAARLGRRGESDAWMRRMEAKVDENRPAMIATHLCRGEADAAERILIGALESDDWRDQAILWMQDWQPRTDAPASLRAEAQFAELRARPAVQAAFARVGHRLRLPLPSTLYGF
nr:hypothetical protein [Pseudomonadota bacterium]